MTNEKRSHQEVSEKKPKQVTLGGASTFCRPLSPSDFKKFQQVLLTKALVPDSAATEALNTKNLLRGEQMNRHTCEKSQLHDLNFRWNYFLLANSDIRKKGNIHSPMGIRFLHSYEQCCQVYGPSLHNGTNGELSRILLLYFLRTTLGPRPRLHPCRLPRRIVPSVGFRFLAEESWHTSRSLRDGRRSFNSVCCCRKSLRSARQDCASLAQRRFERPVVTVRQQIHLLCIPTPSLLNSSTTQFPDAYACARWIDRKGSRPASRV